MKISFFFQDSGVNEFDRDEDVLSDKDDQEIDDRSGDLGKEGKGGEEEAKSEEGNDGAGESLSSGDTGDIPDALIKGGRRNKARKKNENSLGRNKVSVSCYLTRKDRKLGVAKKSF